MFKKVIGDIILEIPDPKDDTKADALTNCLREALCDFTVRITRLVKTAELLLTGLNNSMPDVMSVVAKVNNCTKTKVQTGFIKITERKPFGCVR